MPFVVVSVWPTRAVPEIVGSAETTGGPVVVAGAAAIGAVGADLALAVPVAFVASMVALSGQLWSAATGVYVLADAPVIETQLSPAALQRHQWKAYEVGDPDHVPVETVSTLPTFALPEITGSAVFTGAPIAALANPVRARTQTSAAKSAVRRVFVTRAAAFPKSA